MSFFSRVGAALGVGGVRIDILLAADAVSPGMRVAGTVVVTGASHGTTVNRVVLELRQRAYAVEGVVYEDWHGFDYGEYPVQEESTVAMVEFGHGQPVAAAEQVEWPFELDVPVETVPTRFGVEYGLVVTADVPGQIDPRAAVPLEILAPAEMPVAPAVRPVVTPAVSMLLNQGARVNAMYADGNWYPADVVHFDPELEQYFVHYDDGAEAWVTPAGVRLMPTPIPPGTWVSAPWDGEYYPAVVLQAADGQYYLRWEDGSEGWLPADQVVVPA